MNPVLLSTKNFTITPGSGIDSRLLVETLAAYTADLARIAKTLNDNLLPITTGLPTDTGIDPIVAEVFDGAHLYVDNDGINNNDALFYDDTLARNLTIKEALLLLVSLIAKNAGSNYRSDTEVFTFNGSDYEFTVTNNLDIVQKDDVAGTDWLTHFALYYFPVADDGKGYRVFSSNGYEPDSDYFDVTIAGGVVTLTLGTKFQVGGDLEAQNGDKFMLEYSLGTVLE